MLKIQWSHICDLNRTPVTTFEVHSLLTVLKTVDMRLARQFELSILHADTQFSEELAFTVSGNILDVKGNSFQSFHVPLEWCDPSDGKPSARIAQCVDHQEHLPRLAVTLASLQGPDGKECIFCRIVIILSPCQTMTPTNVVTPAVAVTVTNHYWKQDLRIIIFGAVYVMKVGVQDSNLRLAMIMKMTLMHAWANYLLSSLTRMICSVMQSMHLCQ